MDELFKLMQLFVKTYPDSTDQELAEIRLFRRQTLQLYIQVSNKFLIILMSDQDFQFLLHKMLFL